ncbi:carph-isopro domain-containing protein [Acinetobacter pollinis]|uniref:carph-isopro domain-containing protein n=1 Tax=Acinetobacter pollinis TaxID=2605270 RepID=UPI0018A2F303|nr:YdaS family helix-turn-helix protein [Acinetobacter pollinis]MBF7691119.1 helix-turn-helix domain-containing protein [Acinetobacter pollinis]MBF7698765.1 helix-turn-helix domain-containing protein [Acinetobacter pollinis]
MDYKSPNAKNIREIIMKSGGVSSVARACDMRRTSIYKWIYKGWIPPARIEKLSELSGIPCSELYPETFPKK